MYGTGDRRIVANPDAESGIVGRAVLVAFQILVPYASSLKPEMTKKILRVLTCTIAAAVLAAGCSALPGSGPSSGAAVQENASEPQTGRFVVVDLTDDVLHILARRPPDASLSSFGARGGSAEPLVGVGDSISVSIWEAGAGGLFSPPTLPGQAGSSSRATVIPDQVVGRDGMISVPYAGRIGVVGRRPVEIQRAIERALTGKAIQPQVLVSVPRPISSSVTVVGEGTASARVPLSPKGDRILDVLATAGLKTAVSETLVQLVRGSRSVRVPMTRIAADPRENIFVAAGDVITVLREPQFFIAHGATGRNADVPFETETVSLSQALAKVGGLLDYRADPDGVFVYRLEPTHLVKQFAKPSAYANLGQFTKVVYRVNLRDPNSMFTSGQFRIFNRDVIYVSNSSLSELQKVLQLFSTVAVPAAQTVGISNAFR